MNAEELYDAFARIDGDLLNAAAPTQDTIITKRRPARRAFRTALASLLITAVFAAAELTVFAVGASYADMTLGEYFGKVFRKEIDVDISGAVAVVNGEPVYRSSLDFLIRSRPDVDEKTALEELIKQVLLTQEAEKRGYGARIKASAVQKTVETQMKYLERIAALPLFEQPEAARQILEYLSENNITIEEYYLNEESFRTYRNVLMRSALLNDIAKGETDPEKRIEIIESFKAELYENAEIDILLTEEQTYVLYGDYMNTGRDMVVSGGRKIDDIVKTVGKRCVDEELESAKGLRDVPKGIYCDINIYYVSYCISGLGDLTPEAISKAPDAWPYIHIPIFCTYEGQKRVFGEVLLKPTVTDYSKMTWDYVRSDLVYCLPDIEPYKSGMDCKIWTVAPAREDLARFCLEKGIGEYKAAMHFFYRERWQDILLIQTDTGEYVYDIGDTLVQISGRPLTNDKIRVYTLREYKELLEAHLKEHGGQSGIGGGVGAVAAEKGEVGKTALWIAGAVLLCYLVSLAAVIIKAKKPALAPASGETAAECYPAFAPRRGTFKPRALAAVMIALLVVGAGVTAFYLTHGDAGVVPNGVNGTQSVQPSEVSAVGSENSEVNRPDEPVSNYFGSYDLEGFLDFINNGGKTPAHTGGHLWGEYAENADFIEWVDGKAQIPVPVTASGFKVTYSCVGKKEYSFYISGDSGEKLTAQVTVCEIPSGETSGLSEIVRRYMAESGKAFYDADGEHISGECGFGEYVLYDRHPWKSEFQGEETTSVCPPVLFFRYGDYLVRVTDRRNPEAEKWDIHFLDCFDLEMYEMQK